MVWRIAMPKSLKSLKGQLLLDGGKLRGSSFDRTVVLICEHTAEGAFGLVLNRPSENQLVDVLPAELPERLKNEVLFGGGPVQPAAMSFLVHKSGAIKGNVLPGLNLGHSLEELQEHGEGWLLSGKLRVFAGYAGWAPGQLDDEMRREAWLTHPASPDLIFLEPAAKLWHQILKRRSNWKERLLADAPDDLSLN